MNFSEIKDLINKMMKDNYKEFVKALISIELNIDNEKKLDDIYNQYMEKDEINLINDKFSNLQKEHKEVSKDKDNLKDLVGNIVNDVKIKQLKSNNKVANFSIVSKNKNNEKVYHNISVYGEAIKELSKLNKGDFIKLSGYDKVSFSNGKKYTNFIASEVTVLKPVKSKSNNTKDKEIEIKEVLSNSIDEKIEKILELNNLDIKDFSKEQMSQIILGLDDSLGYPLSIEQVSLYANPKFNVYEMQEIRSGLESGLSIEQVSLYADERFDWDQMGQIRWGLEKGLDVRLYADPKFDSMQMRQIRYGLESGLSVDEILNEVEDKEIEIKEGLER